MSSARLRVLSAIGAGALVAACAFAELFEPNIIVGYTTIDNRRPVATFQTATRFNRRSIGKEAATWSAAHRGNTESLWARVGPG